MISITETIKNASINEFEFHKKILTDVLNNIFYNVDFDDLRMRKLDIDRDLSRLILNNVPICYFSKAITYSIEYIDTLYFNSNERKSKYYSKGKFKRTLLSLNGEFSFYRYSYIDKYSKNKHFYFIDELFNLKKRVLLTPTTMNKLFYLIGKHSSIALAGMELGSYILKHNDISERFKYISRATACNYLKKYNIQENFLPLHIKANTIYIELDEHFVPEQLSKNEKAIRSQNNLNKKSRIEVKAAKIYTGRQQYKSDKSKICYINRFILLDDLSGNFKNRLFEFVCATFDLDYVQNIYIQGDGANWIKTSVDLFDNKKAYYLMDKFHYFQALTNITTFKNKEEYNVGKEYILNADREGFKKWLVCFKNNNSSRMDTIDEKSKYILNNWSAFERTLTSHSKCAMESCISHSLASICSSRPKGFKRGTLRKRLHIRSMYLNAFNDEELFYKQLRIHSPLYKENDVNFSFFDDQIKSLTYTAHKGGY